MQKKIRNKISLLNNAELPFNITGNALSKKFTRISAEEFFQYQFKRLNHLITDPRKQVNTRETIK